MLATRRITEVKRSRSRDRRVQVYLDGKYAFSLSAALAISRGISTGQELSAADLDNLLAEEGLQRCRAAAERLLSYRPRSEAELRSRLERRGFTTEVIEKTVSRLKDRQLLDDSAFARFWQENRGAFRPQSRRLTELELMRKGVPRATVAEATQNMDDGEAAYRAALKRARRPDETDYNTFRRRTGDYLRRRGFDYSVINQTISTIWKETGGSNEV